MEKLDKALETLEHFKSNKQWNDFFKKAKRLQVLEQELIDQTHNAPGAITDLDREALTEKTWMNENRDKIASDLTKTSEEYQAVHDAIEDINDCSWFHLKEEDAL